MNLATRCIPLGILPYDSIEATTRMMAKLFCRAPYLPLLPKISNDDTLVYRTLYNIPGVQIAEKKIYLRIDSNHYKKNMSLLEKAFNHPSLDDLEQFAIKSPFLDKYFQMITKFNSPNAIINLLGPFTISQILINAAEEQMLADKTYRKLFIQSICVKALWMIKKIKSINPSTIPVVILEEPMLSKFGDLRRENDDITSEVVTALLMRVVEKLREAGAIVGIQCLDKCDWKIPIKAGVDIISYDAYNNPNNLCIIPEQVSAFLERGGKINWGIVPVLNETMVQSLNVETVMKRLFATMQGLVISGVLENDVYNSALVSVQGNIDKLPVVFAEKALIISSQLSKRIPTK